jgi:hypothetical protein
MRPRTLALTPAKRAELGRARDHDRRAYVRERAGGLLKVADGWSARRVARHGLLRPRKPDAVYAWLDAYERDGLAGLVHKPRGHRGLSPPAGRAAA